MKIFFAIIFTSLSLLLVPQIVSAQTSSAECQALQELIEKNGGGRASELPKICSETQLYTKLANGLYYLVGIGAVLMIIYGGYVYITAGSNENRVKDAKRILLYTIVGVIVALLAVVVVNIVVNLIVDNKFL